MTNREFFKAIVKANINADLTAHAEAEIAKRTFMSANKQENKPIIKRTSGRWGRRYIDPTKAL